MTQKKSTKKTYTQALAPCPCLSGERLANCCGPLLYSSQTAVSPEALMRSRYTANARKAYKYLQQTWHPSTRPATRGLVRTWLGLEVLHAFTAGDQGEVEFKAWFGHNDHRHCLHERSQFVFEQERWWYVDGELLHADHCGH